MKRWGNATHHTTPPSFPTSPLRTSPAMTPRLPGAGHLRHWQMVRGEISRFPRRDRIDMPGSQTPPGPYGTRSNAPYDVAFR